ncbi:MAG: hypothetical protein IJT94_00620 [Oscillibacter sp.]|nr:hypothetical protein [Oscillibacter sp.]
MYRLRLIKGRSYRGYGVTATRESPVVEVSDAATAQKLYESGYFDEVLTEQPPESGQESGQNPETGPEAESGESASGSEAGQDTTPEADAASAAGAGDVITGHLDREFLESVDTPSLVRLATDMGIDTSIPRTRDALIAAIEADEVGAEPEPDYDALSAMTKAELTAYAQERGIDISKCRTKGDILTAISMAYGGSPTMIDLQREPGNQGGD